MDGERVRPEDSERVRTSGGQEFGQMMNASIVSSDKEKEKKLELDFEIVRGVELFKVWG